MIFEILPDNRVHPLKLNEHIPAARYFKDVPSAKLAKYRKSREEPCWKASAIILVASTYY